MKEARQRKPCIANEASGVWRRPYIANGTSGVGRSVETEWKMVFVRRWGWELSTCWVWSNADVLEEARGGGCTTVCVLETVDLCIQK